MPPAAIEIVIIFSFGSNMSLNRLRKRTPSAEKFDIGYIEGYEFKCNKISRDGSGKANIVKGSMLESNVWGVLYTIKDSEKIDLDRVEGLGFGYHEDNLQIKSNNNSIVQAQVYIADEEVCDDNLKPYDWYKAYIINGAKNNKLPHEYLKLLENLPIQIDKDEERRMMNYNILNAS